MAGAVAQATGKGRNNAGTSQAVTFGTLPTAGRNIVVLAWLFSGDDTAAFPSTGCTDNQGNPTYSQAFSIKRVSGATALICTCYYVENIAASGTFTVTVAPTGTQSALIVEAYECSGLLTSGSLDVVATNSGTSATSVTTGTTATTAQADELAFAVAVATDGVTVTLTENAAGSAPSSGWVQRVEETDNDNYQAGNGVSLVLAATVACAHAWSSSGLTRWAAGVATFKAAGAAAAAAQHRIMIFQGIRPLIVALSPLAWIIKRRMRLMESSKMQRMGDVEGVHVTKN